MQRQRAVIVGAGIIGVSLAYVMSGTGRWDVTVLESEPDVARGVTALGSGGFRQQFTTPEEVALSRATLAGWRRIERDHGVDLGLRRNGYLTLGSTERAAATIQEHVAGQRALGADVELLSGAALQAVVPGMRVDDVPIAALTREDGYGHPPTIARILLDLAVERGVLVRYDTRVTAITTAGNRVTGVVATTAEGTTSVPADLVVNAAGLGSPEVAAMAGLDLSLGLWRQHQFRTDTVAGVTPTSFPCLLDPVHDLYMRPDGDGALVGYAEAWDAERLDWEVDPTIAEHALERLTERWPDAAAGGFTRAWVGRYELTPDRRALIGTHPSVDGYVYSTGYSGHGLMNSLGAAESLVAVLEDRTPAIDLAAFSHARFAAGDAPMSLSARDDGAW